MSYCRFGDGDVYFYLGDGVFWCCACPLGGKEDFATREESIVHLEAHEAAGHSTGDAIDLLREQLAFAAANPGVEVPFC